MYMSLGLATMGKKKKKVRCHSVQNQTSLANFINIPDLTTDPYSLIAGPATTLQTPLQKLRHIFPRSSIVTPLIQLSPPKGHVSKESLEKVENERTHSFLQSLY